MAEVKQHSAGVRAAAQAISRAHIGVHLHPAFVESMVAIIERHTHAGEMERLLRKIDACDREGHLCNDCHGDVTDFLVALDAEREGR